MKFETKVKNYVNLLADFAERRKDRSQNVIKLSMQYDRLCSEWRDIIPDILLNKMLDSDDAAAECVALNSIIDCENNERIMLNVEMLMDLYDKFKDKKQLISKILK